MDSAETLVIEPKHSDSESEFEAVVEEDDDDDEDEELKDGLWGGGECVDNKDDWSLITSLFSSHLLPFFVLP